MLKMRIAASVAACAATAGMLLPATAHAVSAAPAPLPTPSAPTLNVPVDAIDGAPSPLIAMDAQRAGVALPNTALDPAAAAQSAPSVLPSTPSTQGEGPVAATSAAAATMLRLSGKTVMSRGQSFPGSNRPVNFSGDGGPAINATIFRPTTIIADRKGGYYFTDSMNNYVRQVTADGNIRTVAGSGAADGVGCAWDVPARQACLWVPHGIDVDTDGGIIITDTFHNVITKL